MRKILALLTTVAVGALTFWIFQEPILASQPKWQKIKIGSAEIRVEMADTVIKRYRGLSGRKFLIQDQGMLFVFPAPGHYGFVMRGMKFPLDFVWLDANKKVVETTTHIKPSSYPKVFRPSRPVQYVLEVNAGWVEKNNIQPGLSVTLP